MSPWTTRPGGGAFPEPAPGFSPSLLFHKWHAYDRADGRRRLDSKESRVDSLGSVAEAVDRVMAGDGSPYALWHSRYAGALSGCGVEAAGVLAAPTVWRLVIGFGSNPALETGLQLHPLLGFPYLPGSAVRGLVHHVAELTLGEGERAQWPEPLTDEEVRDRLDERESEVEGFLVACECVWRLFGSLHLETTLRKAAKQAPAAPASDPEELEEEIPLPTPRDLLLRWQGALRKIRPEEGVGLRRKIDRLLDTTGGRLVFYDAVPALGQSGLLQVDILNPHYPDYYREPGKHPPSDDQDPTPVYFLAVAPGKRFEFRYRWKDFAGDRRRAQEVAGRKAEGLKAVAGWLREGLRDYGAGGKTAAGYGYFELPAE